MQNMTTAIKNEGGSVLVMALLFLAILTVIGIAATQTSNIEVQISSNALEYNIAFYAADAGIEAGRAMLNEMKIHDAGSWDLILAGTQFSYRSVDYDNINDVLDVAAGGRTVGGATYTLVVDDNDDLDARGDVDTDDTVWLTSAGNFRNSTVTIRSLVRGGGEAYAQEHYSADSTGDAATESAAVADGVVW